MQQAPRLSHAPAPPRLAFPLAVLAVVMLFLSAYFFRPAPDDSQLGWAVITLAVGALSLGTALYLRPDMLLAFAPPQPSPLNGRTRAWVVVLGIAALALLAEISGRVFDIPVLERVSPHLQFGLLVLGVALIGVGLGGAISIRFANADRAVTLALLGIIAIGLVLRLVSLDLAARYLQDENVFSTVLMHYWNQGTPGLYNGGGLATITMLYPYWNAATVELFGRNLVGLRVAGALLGAAVIPVMFEIMRLLFNSRVALVAALLVATHPLHVHHSRISWGHMGDSLFGMMAIMFFIRAMLWNRRVDWVWAGVSLGFTHYFYEVGRLLFTPVLLGWIVMMMLFWRRWAWWRSIALTLFAAIVIAAPVYYTIAAEERVLMPRSGDSALTGESLAEIFNGAQSEAEARQIWDRMTAPFLIYVHHGDGMQDYYGGFDPFIHPVLVPFFLWGAVGLLARPFRPSNILLLGIMVMSVSNIFAINSTISARYAAFSPLLPMLVALGIWNMLEMLKLGSRRAWLATAAALAATWQVVFYVGVHLPDVNWERRRLIRERDLFDAVLRAPSLPPNTELFLIDPAPALDYGRAQELYMFLVDSPYRIAAPTREAFDPAALPRDRNYAFFIARDDTETLARIQRAFPDAEPPSVTPYTHIVPEWDQYVLVLWRMP